MKKLNVEQLNNVEGQTSREEYCNTLWGILTGGGYQGDILWGWEVYGNNCAGQI